MKLSAIRTKIVATIGPASQATDSLTQLMQEGVDVFRLNFAHGKAEEHKSRIANIRWISKSLDLPVGILQDLPGPKVRVGPLAYSPLELKRDDRVTLIRSGSREPSIKTIPISYPRLTQDLKPGHAVYIADGLIRLTVLSKKGDGILARVTNGGVVRTGNGVNMPDSALSLRAFTREDQNHLAFGLKHGVDFVGVSFVGDESDLEHVRAFCRRHGREPFLIAKIERRQALQNLEAIVEKCDGVMVARGDLGVEVPFAEIPGLQKHIVSVAHKKGKPVIVATQVLESMIQNPRPTRAEATDIANGVREEADAIMLSGETAVGKYPIESVRSLNEVIRATEKEFNGGSRREPIEGLAASEIIAHEACDMAEWLKASLIVIPTRSGLTAARISRFRPSVPVLALVNDETMRRRLSLYWGINTLPMAKPVTYQNVAKLVRTHLLKNGLAHRGQMVLLVSGATTVPAGQTGMVQTLIV